MEGGYQNRADDGGNYACGDLVGTNMGVSAVAYETWVGRCPSAAEMEGLDESTAFSFYAWYFDKYRLYPIESQQLFELLANNTMGSPAGAARAEQRALNRLGYTVAVDGNRGAQTIAALNEAWRKSPAAIYNAVREEWIAHLRSIDKPQFLQGWLARMARYFPPMQQHGTGAPAWAYVGLLLLGLYAWAKK